MPARPVGYSIAFGLAVASLLAPAALRAQGQPLVFTAMGDIPYGSSEVPILQQQIRDHNTYSPSEFMVHIGDIKSGDSSCSETHYRNVAGYLAQLRVPTFIIPGDNEWTDCSSPSQAWTYWTRWFTDFEARYCGTPVTEHQSARHENWAFTSKGVLFIGINLVAPPSSINQTEWNARLQQDADWVSQQLQSKASSVRSAVVFSHDGPGDSRQNLFFTQFRSAAATFGKPILLLHGDDHAWKLDRPFSQTNVQRLQVDNGAAENPVQITVTTSASNPFVFLRDPWNDDPQPFNAPPCGGAVPVLAIDDLQILEGNAGTATAVFTVSLSGGNGDPVSVNWSTVPGTATSETDYVGTSGTLQFSGSTVSRTLAVEVRGDTEAEPDETFHVDLANASGAAIGDPRGTATITNDDIGAAPLRFGPLHDAVVSSSSASSPSGSTTTLRAKTDSSIYNSYLKFGLSGITGTVVSASLELYCTDESDNAGAVHLVSNNYRNSASAWVESGVTYNNAPVIDGAPLNSPVEARPNTWIRIDVTAAITGDGTYSFALRNPSGNSVYFSSKEGANDPVLVVTMSQSPPPPPVAPTVTSFSPGSGPVGTEVTITGTSFNGTTAVRFNGTPAAFAVDSSTRLRATVPPGALSGPIEVTNAAGSATSVAPFNLLLVSTFRFEPVHDTQSNSSSRTATAGSSTTLRTKADSSIYNIFLKFAVTGVAGPVESAILELYCTDESDNSGAVYLVSNNYLNTTTPWIESGLHYDNAPAISGTPVDGTPVAAVTGRWIQFDVTSAITANGTYSLALRNPSGNSVYYSSKEGANHPVLVVRTGAPTVVAAAPEEAAKTSEEGATAGAPGDSLDALPARLFFSRPVPNPTQGTATFSYALPRAENVTLSVYDVSGQVVRRMEFGSQSPGAHRAAWDGKDNFGRHVPSGVYFLRLHSGPDHRDRRVTIVR